MKLKHFVLGSVAGVILIGSGLVVGAEDPNAPEGSMPGMEQMREGMMGGGMMGGGMMGMKNMMERCDGMMRGGMGATGMVPHLPPGNEKLQLQMQAEIMQQMGEILAKYAGRVKDGQEVTR